jgi:hypothetical protein
LSFCLSSEAPAESERDEGNVKSKVKVQMIIENNCVLVCSQGTIIVGLVFFEGE